MAIEKNELENESAILRFYRKVLTWDYLRILNDSKKRGKGSSVGLKMVKETYKDVDDYLTTFEPLLLEEVKAQIAQGRSDEENAGEVSAVIAKCVETDGFHLVTVIMDATQSLSQNDLIFISKTKLVGGKELPTKYAFGLVEHCRNTNNEVQEVELRMNLKGEVKCQKGKGFEPSARLLNMCTIVSEVNSSSQAVQVSILKICSLSTIAREYVALRSISSLPFKDLVLAAKEINISEDQKWVLSKTLMESLENNHNESQMDSIRVGLSRKRFVLIQGPPGTGKTQTILGLLSAVLHATPARVSSKDKTLGIKRGPELPIEEKYNHWQKAAPWLSGINPRDAIMPVGGDDGFFPTTGNDMRPEVISSSRKHRVRVLVCAPSNSALDEIVLRLLKTGIRDENDRVYNPKIVRIGLKPHHTVQTVSMEHLIKQKRAALDFKGNDKNKQGGGGSENDSLRSSILEEAAIVFSTLSFSGSPLFSKLNRGFDVVIIDEAAQAVEAATLIPLANGCKQVFLVGDPVQLPATVISTVAGKFGYGMSLFKRFQKAGYQVVMLKTQYRMHPEIRSFPSGEFYGGELEDGIDVEDQTRRAWHDYKCFGPFCFFDIHDGKESQPTGNTGSYVNEDEVDFVLAMYHKLVSKYPELKESSRLAIISPYQQQVKLVRERFQSSFGVESKTLVDIGTIDGFQGREKDVAIFSCVRANETQSIGFVSDFRRMNVGITRARSSVLVVGSVSTLEKDKHWKSLIDSARTRGCMYKVSKPYKNFFSDESIKTMLTVPEEPMDDTMGMNEAIFGNAEDAEQVPGDDDFGGDGDDGCVDED